MLEVVLVLVPPNSTPIWFILEEIGMMRSLKHLIDITQDYLWNNYSERIIQLVPLVVFYLLLHMVVIMLVWLLGPTILPPKTFIIGLMVVIMCYL